MPLLWNHSGGGQANSHFLFFSPLSSPVAFKGVFQLWFPDFVTPSNAADWPVAGKTRRKMFSVGGQQGERARPTGLQSPRSSFLSRVFMWQREQNQDQHASECCNKRRETGPCFHKKHKLGAIFIKNNVLSFQALTVRAAGPAKQLYLGVFHSLLRTPERFAAITAEAEGA